MSMSGKYVSSTNSSIAAANYSGIGEFMVALRRTSMRMYDRT